MRGRELVVSQNRGTPMQTQQCFNPYYRGTPKVPLIFKKQAVIVLDFGNWASRV